MRLRILLLLVMLPAACTPGQETGISNGATQGSVAGAWAGPAGLLVGAAIGAGIGLATAREDYPTETALTPPPRVIPADDVPVPKLD